MSGIGLITFISALEGLSQILLFMNGIFINLYQNVTEKGDVLELMDALSSGPMTSRCSILYRF